MARIRVMVADDHALVRAGLNALLATIAGLEVVGEARDGEEALHIARELRPDVILMDVTMAPMNGLEAARAIRSDLPATKIIMLSVHLEEAIVKEALGAGASGYLSKSATAAEFELAIAAVARGDVYLSPAVTRPISADYLGLDAIHDPGQIVLTPRQREVLKLIGEGRNTKQIARLLNVGTKTVESHRAQIMERLGVHDIANLILEAARKGLISLGK